MSEPDVGGWDAAALDAVPETDTGRLPGDGPGGAGESAPATEGETPARFADGNGDGDGDGETLSEDGWVQVTPPDEIPEPPPEIARAARFAPEHFIYMADPNWRGEGPAPSWAVFGRWRTDARGEIVDWEDNEEYRPSPEALGWRPPADPVDEAAQRAVTGYGPVSEVPRALAREPRIAVVVEPDGAPRVGPAPDGTQAIPVFTVPPEDENEGEGGEHGGEGEGDGADEGPGLPPHRMASVTELLELAGETALLYLSPTAPVTMTLDTETLRAAVEGREIPEPTGRPWPEEPEEPEEPEARETADAGLDEAAGQPSAVAGDPALEDVPPAADVPFALRGGLVSQDYGRTEADSGGGLERAGETGGIQPGR
ncbi:type VII secretion system-associated protein [Streptomyces sp. NPDC017966]|uniref:type VII secretion system-associated protein n=1 Tax=Streptomyces sp. NPDC017966 TaxID=3365023 RepID=UPI00379E93C6